MRGDQSGHLRGSPLHYAIHFSPCTFVCLNLPSPPTSCLLISPSLSVSVSLAILCFLPILPSSSLFPFSLSPSSLPLSPLPHLSPFSYIPPGLLQDGEEVRTTHPSLHSCCSISNPKGSRRESWAFEATSGATAGITHPPNIPLASAFSPFCLLHGRLRALFQGAPQ